MGPVLYELLFGILVVYFWNVMFFERGLGINLAWWRHAAVTIFGASAFLINSPLLPFSGTGMQMPMTLVHTLVFFLLFVFLLVVPVKANLLKKIPLALCAVTFTGVFMTAEGLMRSLVSGDPLQARYAYLISIGLLIALITWEAFRTTRKA